MYADELIGMSSARYVLRWGGLVFRRSVISGGLMRNRWLDFRFITPSEESWGDGDREILCTVYDPAGDTTGTLADANR